MKSRTTKTICVVLINGTSFSEIDLRLVLSKLEVANVTDILLVVEPSCAEAVKKYVFASRRGHKEPQKTKVVFAPTGESIVAWLKGLICTHNPTYVWFIPDDLYMPYAEIVDSLASLSDDVVIPISQTVQLTETETKTLSATGSVKLSLQQHRALDMGVGSLIISHRVLESYNAPSPHVGADVLLRSINAFAQLNMKVMVLPNLGVRLRRKIDIKTRILLEQKQITGENTDWLTYKNKQIFNNRVVDVVLPKGRLLQPRRDEIDSSEIGILSDAAAWSGIHGFSKRYAQYLPGVTMLSRDTALSEISAQIQVVVVEYYDNWNREANLRLEKICASLTHRKLIFIVHEINELSYRVLHLADFLIFVTQYQKDICEDWLGIKKPNLVLGILPRDTNRKPAVSRLPYVFFGGRYYFKEDLASLPQRGLYNRVKFIVNQLNDKNAKVFLHPCLGGMRYSIPDFCRKEMDKIAMDELLYDRVVYHFVETPTVDDMIKVAERCKWAYLWRDDIALSEFHSKLKNKDPSLLKHMVGDSGMYRDCLEAGCIPMVEPRMRYAAHFDGVKPISWYEFSKLLRSVVAEI